MQFRISSTGMGETSDLPDHLCFSNRNRFAPKLISGSSSDQVLVILFFMKIIRFRGKKPLIQFHRELINTGFLERRK